MEFTQNDMVCLLGAKEVELAALRKQNAQLKGAVAELEKEVLRLRAPTGQVGSVRGGDPLG